MDKLVKLKAKETAATNADFYNLFRPIAPSIDLIGKVAQVISGLTEAITIWYITQSELSGTSKIVSILVSIIAMLLVVAVLELGGRKFVQVLTRAIVWKRLKNAWYISLFVIVGLITIGMGALSFRLSTNGIRHAFVSNVPVAAQFDHRLLKQEYREEVTALANSFDDDFRQVKAHHTELLTSTSDAYEANIESAKLRAEEYDRKFTAGAAWAKSHADKYRKKVAKLESEKTKVLRQHQTAYAKKLDQWQNQKRRAIDQEKAALKVAIAKGEDAVQKVHQKQEKDAYFWGSLLSFFVGFSVLLAFVCIISVEVYRRGCGIQVEYEEEEHHHSIWSIFWMGLVDRVDHFFRSKAERFASRQTHSGRSQTIGFNYAKPMLSNHSDSMATNESRKEGKIQ
ncbi:MAG: hypothetical protein AAF985_14895 [Bacteroidota bacterium]